ncbi:MAG: Fe-S metabolism associated SufE [Verrucomicrobiaceae bacterium]|nr:Fe-S metabolism associated SufE [Verrucomicrobiaceae bacterium]
MYPPPLQSLIEHFESLSEGERRDGLIDLAETVERYAPNPGEHFDFEQVRKDAECSDTVGIHIRREPDGRMRFAVSLGCGVQTLTKALTTVLCQGFNGARAQEVLATPEDFIARIIGEELVRIRSRTVYYVFKRMKEATAGLAQSLKTEP